MTSRRCCCTVIPDTSYPCQPCPDPLFPPLTRKWRVSVEAWGVIADSAGQGTVAGGEVIDCKRGGCGRQKYRRKALGIDTFALGVCDETTLCDAMIDEDAPEDNGIATIEWSFCSLVQPQENPLDPTYPDITNIQSPTVEIGFVSPNMAFNATLCTWNGAASGETDCRTLIEVTFTYADSFDYPYFTDSGFCDQYDDTYTVSRSWICYYSRRVAPGQFYAEGNYALVKVIYPGGIQTNGTGSSTCTLAGGTICSVDGLTPVTPPTTWKPPAYINLARLG